MVDTIGEIKKTTVNLPVDLVEELRAEALKNYRSLSQQIVFYLSLTVGRHPTNS